MRLSLPVPFFRQDTDYSCGPTSLQMVLRYFGLVKDERSLIADTRADGLLGTSHALMIEVARKNGLYCYVNEGSSLKEVEHYLWQGLPSIVNFIEPSEDEGHYSVVTGLSGENIVLNDPWNGRDFLMRHKDFEDRWYSGDGKSRRWVMVLSPEPIPIGKLYNPISEE